MILNTKTLFAIDGLGALLSVFLLGVVLVQFESLFGMPKETLYFLAFLPCLFAVYDLVCYLNVKRNELFFFERNCNSKSIVLLSFSCFCNTSLCSINKLRAYLFCFGTDSSFVFGKYSIKNSI